MIPHSELVVLGGAAHGLMVEAPNAFNDAVIGFIERVVATERIASGLDGAAATA